MRTVALIDYGSGNLRSAEKALARVAAEESTGHGIVVTADPAEVEAAERIVLPGVGAFADCMRGVSSIPGMIAVLEDKVLKRGTPFLGICVGMQLLAEVGREHGDHKGLGWIPGEVVKISPRRRVSENSSHGLECAVASRATSDDGRDERVRCLFCALVLHAAFESRACSRGDRLWWRDRSNRRAGQHHRHAVSPREEPSNRTCVLAALSEMAAVRILS